MILHKTPWWIKAFYRSLIWTSTPYEDNRPVIYLTFDDGPVPEVTPWVIDLLAQYEARATFFCVGDNVRKHPDTYNLIGEGSHKSANHTFHHVNGWQTPDEEYFREIAECQEVLDQTPDSRPLFRPPYGRIRRKQIEKLNPDYQIIMWDVLSADYNASLSPQKCLDATIRATSAGSIVVFHDSIKAERNLRFVLPAYLEHFSNEGHVFRSL